MRAHRAKLERANVVGVFESQEAAEEAVLELRLAGFRDDDIGFFTRNLAGQVLDFAGKTYIRTGAVLGLLLGAVLGGLAGYAVLGGRVTPIGPVFGDATAVLITNIVCGAMLTAICGAMVGWGVHTREAVHFGSEVESGHFLVTVAAGPREAVAREAILHRGGHLATHVGTVTPIRA